jgi:putative ABC transport system substrate-binding protein
MQDYSLPRTAQDGPLSLPGSVGRGGPVPASVRAPAGGWRQGLGRELNKTGGTHSLASATIILAPLEPTGMKRREFIGIAGGAAAWPLAARGQQKAMPVIGFLSLASPGSFSSNLAAFREGLKETGYIEGQNVVLEYRWADGREDRLPALAAELVGRKVDVIATSGGSRVALAAKSVTSTIPIVFEVGADPVVSGLVASLARPGGNLTGISIMTGDLNPKRFELLSELVPTAKLIAVLVNPQNLGAERVIREVQEAGRAKGVPVQVLRAGSSEDFEPVFSLLQAGALLVGNDAVFFSRRSELVALAARYAVPAMYEWREFVTAGGLISYGSSVTALFRQEATYVGRILAGAEPADLPVQQPTKFELVINLKAAKALGLTVPQSLLARADEVIE